MLRRSFNLWLLTGALVFAAAPWVCAQEPTKAPSQHLFPFEPGEIRYDLELFKPAELSTYGNGPQPNTGLFFSYERLYWWFNRPPSEVIGSTTADPPQTNTYVTTLAFPTTNSLDVGTLRATAGWGNRWEIGYMNEDDVGWMVGILDNVSQNQSQLYHFVDVQFDDPGTILDGYVRIENMPGPPDTIVINVGKMETIFIDFTINHSTDVDGVELLRMNRSRQYHYGGFIDYLYGARFLQIRDELTLIGRNYNTPTVLNNPVYAVDGDTFADMPVSNPFDPTSAVTGGIINPLANSIWGTEVENNMIGPEIGLRWFGQRGRWITSFEARFLAAVNFQNTRFKSDLGDAAAIYNQTYDSAEPPDNQPVIPREFTGLGTNDKRYDTMFTPVGEWRLNVAFQVTQAIALKVGYTGMIAGNIGRATNRMRYDVAQLIGLRQRESRNTFVANGVNFGVEVNR